MKFLQSFLTVTMLSVMMMTSVFAVDNDSVTYATIPPVVATYPNYPSTFRTYKGVPATIIFPEPTFVKDIDCNFQLMMNNYSFQDAINLYDDTDTLIKSTVIVGNYAVKHRVVEVNETVSKIVFVFSAGSYSEGKYSEYSNFKINGAVAPIPISISMISTLPTSLAVPSFDLAFSSPVTDITYSLVDSSGKSVESSYRANKGDSTKGTLSISPSVFSPQEDYHFSLSAVTSGDGGKLDKVYSHIFKGSPVPLITMKSILPSSLVIPSFNLAFSAPVSDITYTLTDSSGKAVQSTYSVDITDDSKGVLNISAGAFSKQEDYHFSLTAVTAPNNGLLDKVYNHDFTANPIPVFRLIGSLSQYLMDNMITLRFSESLKTVNIQLLDDTGASLSTEVSITGKDAVITISDPSFVSGNPYTLKIIDATSVDGGVLKDSITHSYEKFISSGDTGFDSILLAILSIFTVVMSDGIPFVILAVSVGVIFFLARWLWQMSKSWLRRSKK